MREAFRVYLQPIFRILAGCIGKSIHFKVSGIFGKDRLMRQSNTEVVVAPFG